MIGGATIAESTKEEMIRELKSVFERYEVFDFKSDAIPYSIAPRYLGFMNFATGRGAIYHTDRSHELIWEGSLYGD